MYCTYVHTYINLDQSGNTFVYLFIYFSSFFRLRSKRKTGKVSLCVRAIIRSFINSFTLLIYILFWGGLRVHETNSFRISRDD